MAAETLVVTRVPDAVYEALRESILTQREAPGSAVTEQAIADRFRVARPTAKVALERLVADGLLRRTAHKTARVPELTRDDIVDLYAARATVEVAALRNLAESGTEPPGAIAAQRTLRDALASDGGDAAPLARADVAFHRALVVAQRSPRLARLHGLLMGEIELCMGQVQSHRLLALGDVVDQHQGILDAVNRGDAEAAAHLTRDHIEGARDRLLGHYDRTHASTSTPKKD
ncbi:MAG: GntR family transcriptional regulator [Microcella pacifica]|uniref:GntR family transcriptional regulator n=1 Tax=Microcella pacifica TaxID=2591847 RepID=UPI0033163C8B